MILIAIKSPAGSLLAPESSKPWRRCPCAFCPEAKVGAPLVVNENVPPPQKGSLACQAFSNNGGELSAAAPMVLYFRPGFTITLASTSKFQVYKNLASLEKGGFVRNEFKAKAQSIEEVSLSDGGLRIFNTPNAGGNSVASEVMSFEILRTLYGAKLLRTEMEIDYEFSNWKITDYSVKINDQIIGVSVARAMKFGGEFDLEDARRILSKKLSGVIDSTRNACGQYKWKKQILHLWAQHDYIVDVLAECYETMIPPELRSNTMVIATSGNACEWIF